MQNLIGKVVEFTGNILDMDAYAEPRMRARIQKIWCEHTDRKNIHHHTDRKIFDYTDFEDHNKVFESANYYDHQMIPCLTAREANAYQPQEPIAFGSPDVYPFEDYFTVLDESHNLLME